MWLRKRKRKTPLSTKEGTKSTRETFAAVTDGGEEVQTEKMNTCV